MDKTVKVNMLIGKELNEAKARILYKYGVSIDQIAQVINYKPEYVRNIVKDVIPLEEFSEKQSEE